MTHPLRGLPLTAIEDLARALEERRTGWPPGALELRRLGLDASAEAVAAELARLAGLGASASATGVLLRLLAQERDDARRAFDRLELVWTGPEAPGSRSRDTGVVVRELFASAERSVLVSTYAIYQGRHVFKPLADRRAALPALSVRLFVHVNRPYRDPTPESEILRAFAKEFRHTHWPGDKLPEVYYDQRSLALEGERASLHAKCIIVDDRRAFISSANFTEAAHERNIEAGVIVDDARFASALRSQFDALIGTGDLRRLPL